MNTTAPRLPTRESNPAPRRSSRRERGYGTGYGRSSGYADNERRYTNQDANERFRLHQVFASAHWRKLASSPRLTRYADVPS